MLYFGAKSKIHCHASFVFLPCLQLIGFNSLFLGPSPILIRTSQRHATSRKELSRVAFGAD